jgi:ADP-dependent NAD(P)H-hydrate dehydratase / NAD(P)H-hydrate epimerase
LRSLIRVVTSSESKAVDAATIAAGMPSRAMMGRAAAAAATQICDRYADALRRGVLVLAGPGNNGGDGWAVARALASIGIGVRVTSPAGSHTSDSIAERDIALPFVNEVPWNAGTAYTGEGVVVDALLGTGSTGEVHGEIAACIPVLDLARQRAAVVVAIDVPSGLDATTGESNGAVRADMTITFGTVKRGQLVARSLCGTIIVVDIGLTHATAPDDLALADAHWAVEHMPPILAEAHKGTRKKLLLYGGAPGMAGAVILGLRAALRSGIGMVKAVVHPLSVDAIHGAVPATLIAEWPATSDQTPDKWADVLVIGPGLGRAGDAREAIRGAARRHDGPMLYDADALTAFERDLDGLRGTFRERPVNDDFSNRPVLITPHVVELGRLTGDYPEAVLDQRFEIGLQVAKKINATVLLKGVPTIVSSPDGRRMVVAEGTPTLATGGSGDLLSGIAGTLLAQTGDPFLAGALGAWVHGRAAALAGARTRGTTLEDVLEMLPNAWSVNIDAPRYPVLAELPAISAQ